MRITIAGCFLTNVMQKDPIVMPTRKAIRSIMVLVTTTTTTTITQPHYTTARSIK